MTAGTAEKGNRVSIRYAIHLDDGRRIGELSTGKPLTFHVGSGKVLRGLEEGVIGMRVAEKRMVRIAADQGYGQYKEDLVLRVERKLFPDGIRLVPGRAVQYQNRDGERANFVVHEVNEDTVTIDGNHPLAGLDLTYEVELLELS